MADSREVVEGLLSRPLWGDRPLPTLLVTGDTKAVERVTGVFRNHLPYSQPAREPDADLATLVETMARELGRTSVRRTLLPAPRFPLTDFVSWAWDQHKNWPGGWPPASRQRTDQVKERFRARFWGRRLFQGESRRRWAAGDFLIRAAVFIVPVATLVAWWLESSLTDLISLVPGAVALVVGAVAIVVQTARFVMGASFSRWFRTKTLGRLRREPGESRPDYATRLMDVMETEPQLIEELLVRALLEDLRQAYRRWPRIPWPSWGRGLYALIVLDCGDPVHKRFLEILHEVTEKTPVSAPVLIVAKAQAAPPEPADPWANGSFDDRVKLWQGAVTRRGPRQRLVFDSDDLTFTEPFRPRLGRVRLRALGYWGVVLSLLIAPPLLLYGKNWFGCGPGMTRAGRECVGLSDNLSEIGPHPLVRPILERIDEQNRKIDTDQRVVTVFYLGPLTTSRPGDDQVAGSAGELSGLAARQLAYNARGSWQIRLEYANTGQDFRHAEFAARMIKERAAGDPDVAAVVGLAWSRTETQRAIRLLGDAHIPVLSTTNTADETPLVYQGRPSPYFFRMAAPNSAQAMAVEQWLRRGLPGGEAVPPGKVAILVERDAEGRELYSRDLADGLTGQRGGTAKPPYAGAERYVFANPDELADRIERACLDGATVLFYTGRANHLRTVLDLKAHRCGDQVRILAGDEVTDKVGQLLAENALENQPAIDFVALNDMVRVPGNATQHEIERWIGRTGVQGVSRVHAWLSYDALLAVTSALDRIKAKNVDESVNIAGSVAYNLRGLGVDGLVQGASGPFYFSEDAESHIAFPRQLRLYSVHGTKVDTVGACTVDEKEPGTAELKVACSFR
ncbi:ABC transporter substrate-binding protein [Thermoactinospora rubra]|uniref:ABC transporter substrate-binding protein n=1 Tax=Thermoactinospora rubra TaxID=1088767 RepID=UPI001301D5CE|nr:ABC transporter substrate-binding protein [Thermoactinospora rubra]